MNEIAQTLKANGFELIEKIGEGGQASVFAVRWEQYPDEIFAAKVITLCEKNYERRMNSYLNEICSLQRLLHQNVIYIFKHFQVNNKLYMILEYCPKGSLFHLVSRNGPLSIDNLREVARQCLDALSECHANGIVHLDIKPENILINQMGRIKISDFGLADIMENPNGYCEKKQGSTPYCAPERFMKAPFDPKMADVWSLGITFFFCMTGSLPWKWRNNEELRNRIINIGVVYPKNFPPNVMSFLQLLLNHDPKQRCPCADLLKSTFLRTSGSMKLKPTHAIYRPRKSYYHIGKINADSNQTPSTQSSLSFSQIRNGITFKLTSNQITFGS